MTATSRTAPTADWRAVTTLGGGSDGEAPGRREASRGDHEQHDEKERDRDHLDQHRSQAGVDVTGKVPLCVIGDETEDEGTDEGHR